MIRDAIDKNVKVVEASDASAGKTESKPAEGDSGKDVFWTVSGVEKDEVVTVTLTVEVLEGAAETGKVDNQAFVKVAIDNDGDGKVEDEEFDNELPTNEEENPVPSPKKEEVAPYKGTGVLGGVKVGDEITYRITYKNYKATAANVVIKDTLDKNVAFVSAPAETASDAGFAHEAGKPENGAVTWTIAKVPAGQEGTVSLTVRVLEGALVSNSGEGKVVNGDDETTTVKVGNDNVYAVNPVENPVPEEPTKVETANTQKDPAELDKTETGKAKEGGKDLDIYNGVKVGDQITYAISIRNYKGDGAAVVIRDALDKNVKVVEASDASAGKTESKPAKGDSGKDVFWTVSGVAKDAVVTVTLTVEVLEGAVAAGKVDNQAFVKIGIDNNGDGRIDDDEFDNELPTNEEENPVSKADKPKTHQIVIRKTFKGEKITDTNAKDITFTVTNAETGDKVGTYTLGKNFKKDSKGVYTAAITVPEGTYEVTESANNVSGLTCTVSYKVDSKSASDKAAVDLTKEASKTVEVTNTYAKITITPTVTCSPQNSGKWTGVYTYSGGSVTHTSSDSLKGAPKTGDDNNFALYLILLALAAVMCGGVVVVRKKKKKSE